MDSQNPVPAKPFCATTMTVYAEGVGLLCTGRFGFVPMPSTSSFRFEQLSKGVGRIVLPSGRRIIFTQSSSGQGWVTFGHHDEDEGVFHELKFAKKGKFSTVRYTTTKAGWMQRPELREQVTVVDNGRHFVNAVAKFGADCRRKKPKGGQN